MTESIDLPSDRPAQEAVHLATGMLYDKLAKRTVEEECSVSEETFAALERLYVASANDRVEEVRIEFDLADETRQALDH